jgi:hypothetical protein
MTFKDYIQSTRVFPTPRGDYIADTKTLINAGVFPAIDSWSDLYGFMAGRGARPEAIEEARKVWRQYKAKVSEAV